MPITLLPNPFSWWVMTGTSAHVPVGTIIKGFVDEDVPLALQAGTPPPLQVGATPPVAAPVAAPTATKLAPGVSVATPGTKLK